MWREREKNIILFLLSTTAVVEHSTAHWTRTRLKNLYVELSQMENCSKQAGRGSSRRRELDEISLDYEIRWFNKLSSYFFALSRSVCLSLTFLDVFAHIVGFSLTIYNSQERRRLYFFHRIAIFGQFCEDYVNDSTMLSACRQKYHLCISKCDGWWKYGGKRFNKKCKLIKKRIMGQRNFSSRFSTFSGRTWRVLATHTKLSTFASWTIGFWVGNSRWWVEKRFFYIFDDLEFL